MMFVVERMEAGIASLQLTQMHAKGGWGLRGGMRVAVA